LRATWILRLSTSLRLFSIGLWTGVIGLEMGQRYGLEWAMQGVQDEL
jgi:hypothetical protein